MKKLKILSLIMAVLLLLVTIVSCAAAPGEDGDYIEDGNGGANDWFNDIIGGNKNDQALSTNMWAEGVLEEEDGLFPSDPQPPVDGEQGTIVENPFISTEKQPVSTFSADVDTASYAYFRKLSSQGYDLASLIDMTKYNPLRTEEMVNYFDYNYTLPAEGEVFGMGSTVAKTPWNDSTYLLMLDLATEQVKEKGKNNLVFLIDVSGSMSSKDKLPLLKSTFGNLVSALDENDTVSIVTYSGKEEVVLSGCPGNRDEQIMEAINNLEASGSTNGEAGITKAYSLAKDYYIADGNNRIIMASDGDLNVGISSSEELREFISTKKDEGIYLSVMGFGTGNYNDATMSALAQNGNGVYYYIDGEREAEKVLGEDLLSTLYTVAKDVKLQLTFNADVVEGYRLIGYENRMLNNEDFDDDTKDAGEVGAGHALTVCYELVLKDGALSGEENFDFAKLAVRYKLPDSDESTLREFAVGRNSYTETPDDDFVFISAVIETAMILNQSKYNAKNLTLQNVMSQLNDLDLSNDQDKTEFKAIINTLLSK